MHKGATGLSRRLIYRASTLSGTASNNLPVRRFAVNRNVVVDNDNRERCVRLARNRRASPRAEITGTFH